VLLELAPVQRIDFEGKPALLVVARDVTESHNLKDQLARADRLSSLGRLVATVGHELSNPLGCINLNLGILERAISRRGEPEVSERALDALRSAQHGSNRARAILRELATFSRGTESHEPLAVHEAVKSAIELTGSEVELHAELVEDHSPTPPVRANRGRLEQVIVNLLLNAAQSFRDEERSNHRVTVRTRAVDGESVCIEVEDNGAGMDEATRSKIFEPFFSTKPAGEGTGLGLAICRDIIQDMGGEIRVESDEGRGSRFLIRLPAMPARPGAAAAGTRSTDGFVESHRTEETGRAKARFPAL
jgi:signal transduction histidine kinase